jgi:polysaccharide export outer membrane protein
MNEERPEGSQAVRRLLLGFVAVACLLGCAGGHTTMPPPRDAGFSAYRVGAPDLLAIVVLPDPVIEREATVRPDGMISLDLIGDVPAAGRTTEEVAADIQKRMSRYKRDARATVRLLEARSTEVTVLGEVRTPNTFPLVKRTRVVEAIGLVGGETMFARTGKIRVIRTDAGETVVYIVNLNDIRSGDLTTNIMLAEGDIVYVPPNVFARIGYAVNALFMPFQPFMGIANAFMGSAIAGR